MISECYEVAAAMVPRAPHFWSRHNAEAYVGELLPDETHTVRERVTAELWQLQQYNPKRSIRWLRSWAAHYRAAVRNVHGSPITAFHYEGLQRWYVRQAWILRAATRGQMISIST